MAEEAGVVVQLGAAESVAGCEQWVSVRCELTVSDGRRRATCGGLIRAEGGRDATVETGADEAACFPLDATTGRIAPAACPPSCENERSRRRCSCGWRLKISEGALETGALWLVPLPSLCGCAAPPGSFFSTVSRAATASPSRSYADGVSLSLEEWRWRG